MRRNTISFLFLNVGHFLDHFFMLIFASVAALQLSSEWGISYADLILYTTPAFIVFGVCTLLAGWVADKWNRKAMMAIFFIGIGASSIFASFSTSPLQIGISLTLMGVFASIYHPVGIAMVVEGRKKPGVPLAINGVFGNMGVACAALLTGFLIDLSGWRNAFFLPGLASILIGLLYVIFVLGDADNRNRESRAPVVNSNDESGSVSRQTLVRTFKIIFFTTALGGLIFQSTTFSLPKVFDEEFSTSASLIGWYSFLVFSVAAVAQLVVGYLVDNFSIRPVFAIIALLQSIFFLAMVYASGVGKLIVAIAFMLAVFGQIPINDVLVSRVTDSEWRSRAYAIRYVVTFSVMASAVPLIAWVHRAWGFSFLFLPLGLSAALIFIATLFLPTEEHGIKR